MRSSLVSVGLLGVVAAASASAFEAPPASPLLPPDDWAVQVAERLEELGLVDRFMPAQRAVPVLAVERVLAEAEERARAERPDLAPLVSSWRERFERQWSGARTAPGGLRLLGGQLTGGYEGGSVREGPLTPAVNLPSDVIRLEAPASQPFTSAAGDVAWGEHVAAGALVRAAPSSASVSSVELVGAVGGVSISIGRAQVGYGPNEIGAVVATGRAALDRLEFMTTEPWQLPWGLSALGDFTLDAVLARFDEPRHPNNPLLWTFSLQWRPHPRLTIGATRGYMFAPTWDGAKGLSGVKDTGQGNNIYALSMRYRLPTDRFLPLTAKLEWGIDDNPGSAVSWPGIVAGVSVPKLPGLPVSLGVEAAYFGGGWQLQVRPLHVDFSHEAFAWYGHSDDLSWVTHQTPLADPLGGNGKAIRVTIAADPLDARLHLEAMGWLQDRFDADVPASYTPIPANLYAPAASGPSAGASGAAEWRLSAGALVVRGSYEEGQSGWRRSALEIAVRLWL